MIVRALDDNHDFTFGRGKNDYKTDREAVKQNIKTRTLSFKGDCFFDLAAGIDWFNLLGARNQKALELAISSTIINTQDVTAILQTVAELDADRDLLVSYKADTPYGQIIEALTPTQFLTTEDGDILETEDGESIIT